MFKTILVPTDGSALSEKAIQAAIDTAKLSGGKIIGLTVAEQFTFPLATEAGAAFDVVSYQEEIQRWAKTTVEKLADTAKNAGVPCEVFTSSAFSPADEIIKTANEHACDVIFMASHGRKGLNKLFLGSETQRVLAHTSIPVLVLR